MHDWATLSILGTEQGYIFLYRPPSGISGHRSLQALRERTLLSSERLTELQEAIDLAARLIGELEGALHLGEFRSRPAENELLPLCRLLYRHLLPEPIRNAMERLPRNVPLLITTDDSRFPWELMCNEAGFLALQRPVSRCPILDSISLVAGADAPAGRSVLIIANPTFDLDLAEAEASRLSELFDASPDPIEAKIIAREQATVTRVKTELSRGTYAVVHYTGHARPGALILHDGLLTTADIRTCVAGRPFVFLNGCWSAREQTIELERGRGLPYGDTVVRDLATAFLSGGAVGVVGTLWKIREDRGLEFADRFYELTLAGEAVGQALREVRSELKGDYPEDGIWASYVFYGAPNQKVLPSRRTRQLATVLCARIIEAVQPGGDFSGASLETLERLSALIASSVARFGGEIQHATQENVMAFFKVSAGLGPDAQRAMWAALEILQRCKGFAASQASVGSDACQVAIGIEAGEVMISPVSTGLGGEPGLHLIAGRPVGEALWLVQQARPGQILVGQTAQRAGWHTFEFTTQRLRRDDGSGAEVFVLSRALRGPAAPEPGWASYAPMVGRQSELATMLSIWQRCVRGRGQSIWIVGEAGIGKTRLVEAFREALTGQPVRWIRVHPLPYAEEVPYALLLQFLQGCIGDEAGVGSAELPDMKTLGHRLQAWGAERGIDLQPVLSILRAEQTEPALPERQALSGQTEERRRVNEGLLAMAVRKLTAHVSRDRPVVIVLEDAHQADGSSMAVLERTILGIGHLPVLTVAVSRPEWQPPWLGRVPCQTVLLEPLAPAETDKLLKVLLPSDDLPGELIQELAGKAGGNPMFLYELISSLLDGQVLVQKEDRWLLARPLSAIEVPDTLQRAVQSRLETLSPHLSQVLQAAAAVGAPLHPDVITIALGEHMSPEAIQANLAELENLGFLALSDPYREERVFAHPLMREVVYDDITGTARRHYHRRIGEALIARAAAGEETAMGLTAQHLYLSVAGDGIELSQVPTAEVQRAIEYLMRAGASSQQRYASREAATAYQRAVALVERLPAQDKGLLITGYRGLGESQDALGRFEAALTAYERAFGLLRAGPMTPNERRVAADTARRIGRLLGWRAEYEAALSWMNEGLIALAGSDRVEDQACAALLEVHTGSVHYWRGDLETARQHYVQGFELAQKVGDQVALAEAHNGLGAVLDAQGQSRRALEYYRRAYELYEAMNDGYQLARVGDNIGTALFFLGEWDEAFEWDQKGLAFWREIDDRDNTAFAAINIGILEVYRGQWQEAETHLEEAHRLSEEVSNYRILALAHTNLGLLRLAQGEADEGRAHLERSLALLTEHEIEDYPAETYCGLAEAAVLVGDGTQALEMGHKALEAARELEMTPEESIALRLLGLAYWTTGDPEQAEEHLKQSLAVAEGAEIAYEEGRTLLELARLYGETSRQTEALLYLDRAVEIFERLGAAPMLARARELGEILR